MYDKTNALHIVYYNFVSIHPLFPFLSIASPDVMAMVMVLMMMAISLHLHGSQPCPLFCNT